METRRFSEIGGITKGCLLLFTTYYYCCFLLLPLRNVVFWTLVLCSFLTFLFAFAFLYNKRNTL